jgi:hypothetical protein
MTDLATVGARVAAMQVACAQLGAQAKMMDHVAELVEANALLIAVRLNENV